VHGIYVDDVILIGPSKTAINTFIQCLRDVGFALTHEGNLAEYLGVHITHDKTKGTFELTQRGLIDKILETTGMLNCNGTYTPAEVTPLGKCEDLPLASPTWSYSSVIGMLLYLANNSRPDIAFAVHQCARFTHAPRDPHVKAVVRILRYLQQTKTRGLILKPKQNLCVDCYVDSDFCGLWKVEHATDPSSVRSRSGYVITLAGCPLLWASKLQTEIALSTMQAEFVALSLSVRELLPIKSLVNELAARTCLKPFIDIRTHSTFFEDNNGALTLANAPYDTPHSKFYALKYHHFREQVANGTI
jgi:Reverse transcriptase (RNA-dependent DNA polymerase)